MALLAVALNDLRITLKDRGALILLFLVPVVVITIASLALGSAFSSGGGKQTLVIADSDKSPESQALIQGIKDGGQDTLEVKTDQSEADVRAQVDRGDLGGAIVIPQGFGQAVRTGQPTNLIVLKFVSSQVTATIAEQVARGAAQNYAAVGLAIKTAVSAAQQVYGPGPQLGQVAGVAQQQAQQGLGQPAVSTQTETLGANAQTLAKVGQFEQNVPGYAVMFLLFGAQGAATALLLERQNGTLRRLLVAPIGKWTILGGKVLSTFVTSFLQLVVFFVIARILFNLNLGRDLLGLLLLVIAVAAACTGLGILAAAICRSQAQIQGIGTLVILGMSALGGSWWPIEITPKWMQQISHITITAWAMDGFRQLLSYGGTLANIFPSLVVLLAMAAVFFALGLWRFRFI